MIKTSIINAATSGDNTLVAAVPGKRIRVLSYRFLCSSNMIISFKSGINAITGPMHFDSHGGIAAGMVVSTPAGLTFEFQTEPGEALVINLSHNATVGGHMTYQEILV